MAFLCAVFLCTKICCATVIFSPLAVLETTMGNLSGLAQTINQSGLSTTFASGTTDAASYIATNPTHGNSSGTRWESSTSNTGTITLDLGSSIKIEEFILWNSSANATSKKKTQIQSFTVATSDDPTFASSVNVGTFTAVQTSLQHPAQVFDLTDTTARYVRITVNSNFGASTTQIGEMAFGVDTTVIPEPNLLLASILGASLLLSKRRNRA